MDVQYVGGGDGLTVCIHMYGSIVSNHNLIHLKIHDFKLQDIYTVLESPMCFESVLVSQFEADNVFALRLAGCCPKMLDSSDTLLLFNF